MRTGADLVEGDEVIVVAPQIRSAPPYPAVVTKAARVWLTLTEKREQVPESWHRRTWRMRRDSQDESTGYSGNRFFTLEQWAAREARMAAERVLSEANVVFGPGRSALRRDEQIIALAAAVREILDDASEGP